MLPQNESIKDFKYFKDFKMFRYVNTKLFFFVEYARVHGRTVPMERTS